MDWHSVISIVLIVAFLVLILHFYMKEHRTTTFDWPRFVARVAVFSAIASVLYIIPLFSISLPIFPSFLALHFDEIPIFVCGFAYGPLPAFAVILVKTIIKLPFTSTLCVGELSDLLFSTAFVIPAVLIYQKKRNLKGVAIGFAVATLIQVVVAMVMNVYAMLPFYMFVMGFSEEALLAMCQAANPAITNLGWPYAFLAVLPLNLIKDAIVIVVTFIVYRSLHVFLRYQKRA